MKKLLILLALASPLAAELPPLSQEARQQQSQLIVVGKVASVKLLRVDDPKDFPKTVYEAVVTVESVAKGAGLKPGQSLRCTYWKAGPRPKGWAGPGGQYEPLKNDTRVRLYLGSDNQLLNPNGWEKP